MKRKISLVIAFALSFLLMFSPIAKAEETKFNTVTTSEPIELEVAKIPRDTNKADSPSQVKSKIPAIHKPGISTKNCIICPDGNWGRLAKINNVETCLSNCI